MGSRATSEALAEPPGRLSGGGTGSGATTRPCERCGEPFEPYRRWQRFCPGGACRKAAYREREVAVRVAEVVASGAPIVEKVIVYRQPKRRPRPAPAPAGPPDPIVGVMVRALLAAGER